MAETAGNFYLEARGTEQTENAQIIMDNRIDNGWTKEAVSGMLGNMQIESTINAGIYQSLDSSSTTNGFGLVQWTPNTNYINWARNNGYTTYDQFGKISPQLERLDYEASNGLQWIATSEYPISFLQFIISTESPEYLASAFLKNYERAGVEAEAQRRENARYWFDTLNGSGGGGTGSFGFFHRIGRVAINYGKSGNTLHIRIGNNTYR